MRITLLLLLLVSVGCSAQRHLPYDSLTEKITYKEVINVTKVTKEELYSRALAWIALQNDSTRNTKSRTAYTAVGQPIEVVSQNAEEGHITCRSKFRSDIVLPDGPHAKVISYSFILEFKPGRSRIKITDFAYHAVDWTTATASAADDTFEGRYYSLTRKTPSVDAWLAFFSDCDVKITALIASYKDQLDPKPLPIAPVDNW